MKKLMATMMSIAILGGALFGTAGCKNPIFEGEKLTGTNGAKMLLAHERLNENVFSENIDFFGDGSTADVKAAFSDTVLNTQTNRVKAVAAAKKAPAIKPVGYGAEENGGMMRWNEFPDYSSTEFTFSNVITDVESRAEEVAKMISTIKTEIGITDRWVGGYLLHVEENQEVLVERINTEDEINDIGYRVARRYTREDAKNIYDIYEYWETPGEWGKVRTKCIPGEYYESSYVHSSGFADNFIAEKSGEDFKLTRFGYDTQVDGNYHGSLFTHYVLSEQTACGIEYNVHMWEDQFSEGVWKYNLFDNATKNDSFNIEVYDNGMMEVETYFSNIKSGLDYLQAPVSQAEEREEGYDGTNPSLVLSSGEVLSPVQGIIDPTGPYLDETHVQFDLNSKKHFGYASVLIDATTISGALRKNQEYWSDHGVTLKKNLSDLSAQIAYVELLGAEFKQTFEWNGYKVVDADEFAKAQAVLLDFYDEGDALYEEVKNNPTAENNKKPSYSKSGFASITAVSGSGAYAGGKITAKNLSLTAEDLSLFETSEQYVLKVGLALCDSDGTLKSENTVALETGATENKLAFTGTETTMTLTQSGEYVLPVNLSEGQYAVVAYIATAEEGIRVSEMQRIAFLSAEEGRIESSAMDVTVKKSGENLLVNYAVKLRLDIALTKADGYTVEELERALLREALAYGYPKQGETVQTENGEAVTEEVITQGVYRIKCYLSTADGLAEAYIYCTVNG